MRKIVWTVRASRNYISILDYLESEWSEKERIAFHQKTLKALDHIAAFPDLFLHSGKRNIRKYLLSKQTTLFYKPFPDKIVLVAFWDNRRNPLKLKL